MIVSIPESRLSQVAYDFNTQIPKADQTIESRWCTFLPLQQPLTEIPATDTFALIIVAGVKSTHDSKDCNLQKQGLTIVDPTNSKYQVLKATAEHFIPRSRTPLPTNT